MNALLPILALAGVIFVSGCTAPSTVDYSSFTQCLTESGVQEYGAYWCPNCQRVKLTLADAYQFVDYIECDPKCVPGQDGQLPAYCNGHESQSALCLEKGIDKYPSWVKGNDVMYVGTDLTRLSEVSGCQLPS